MSEKTESKSSRTLRGKVVSSKMDKTIVVLIERKIKHPLYEKYIKRSTKVRAHDEDNVCKEGDVVAVMESKPISRTKQWKLVEVLETGIAKK